MTWGTIVPALPLYIAKFGASALILGPIIAAFGVGRVIANIPAGLALRRWSPRPYLRIVAVLLVLITAATGFSGDPTTLIVFRVLAGIFGGAAVTIGFALLVAGAPPDRRGRVMATATAVQMSAGALGAFLGGLVLTWFPIEVAFIVASVPLALCLLWDAVRPATHYWKPLLVPARSRVGSDAIRDDPAPESSAPRTRIPRAASTVAIVGVVSALAISSFATFFARFGGEQGLTPVLGYARGGLTPFTLGLALAAATLVSLAVMPVVGPLIDRGFRIVVLVPSTIAAAVALLLYPLAEGPWIFALVIVLYGLTTSVAGVVPSVMMSESVPPHLSGFVVGITRTAGDLGAVVGPLVAFAAYDAWGAWPAVMVIAGLLLVSNVLLVRVILRQRHLTIPVAASS